MNRRCFILLILIVSLFACFASSVAEEDYWVCPGCGHENPNRANFCASCREPRPTEDITVTAAENAWVCSVCGEICSDGDAFCMICGNEPYASDRRALLLPELRMESAALPPAQIQDVSRDFSAEDEECSLDYTAPVTGPYYIYLKTADQGFKAYIRVYDTQGYDLGSYYLAQGDGFSVELKEGDRYTVKMIQRSGLGSFTLGIGIPKEWTDLGNSRIIADSMSFSEQDNRYTITPQTTGRHYIWISRAMNGFRVWLRVYDRQGYSLGSYYLAQGDGFGVDLAAGETYYIYVKQHSQKGDYELRIGSPRNTADISGCPLIGDVISFCSQENVYTFKAAEDGEYEFRLARADEGFRVYLRVFDQGGYDLGSCYVDQGDSFRVSLSAGSVYTVKAVQHQGFGTYSLEISR